MSILEPESLDEHISRLREGNTLTENEVKALCEKVRAVLEICDFSPNVFLSTWLYVGFFSEISLENFMSRRGSSEDVTDICWSCDSIPQL